MPYQRPDFDALYAQMKDLLSQMGKASDEQAFFTALESLDKRRSLHTQATLAHIRYTINTKDAFYSAENDVMDEATPRWGDRHRNGPRLPGIPFKDAISKKYGPHLLEKFAVELKTFRPEILPDLVEENKLRSEYQKLMASAQIDFEGEIRNLRHDPFMGPPTGT